MNKTKIISQTFSKIKFKLKVSLFKEPKSNLGTLEVSKQLF